MTASLIVAIGPQNAYLLKYGLSRANFVFAIAAIYVVIDVALITLGAIGVGTIIAQYPALKLIFACIAVLFFLGFGIASIRKGLKAGKIEKVKVPGAAAYSTAILLSIANPGVLFDTIVIIGGLAGQYEHLIDRIAFSAGAAAASFLWFFALASIAYFCGGWFTDRAWKAVDIIIGVLMLVLAATIVHDAWRLAEQIGLFGTTSV
ncbi:LysE/ArgO family amino acid transporter [Terrihabitans soli]|nr:LysE family transporter [Terrihabitans soli]